jgi:hypothetical protein
MDPTGLTEDSGSTVLAFAGFECNGNCLERNKKAGSCEGVWLPALE